jgi:hypothetical protein
VDGFCSLDGAGVLVTKPAGPGRELIINAKAEGSVRVSAVDAAGKALLTAAPFTGDAVEHRVEWPAALPGGPVRFRFELQNASLYSFSLR